MNRHDICILINSTPKYFYLLPLQLAMLRRYSAQIQWPVFLATEHPEHETVQLCQKDWGLQVLTLPETAAGFLESREMALRLLPQDIRYVLPLQEDFLLDRSADITALEDALFILDTDRHVSSLRLMPCPGPAHGDPLYVNGKAWRILTSSDTYLFTYQATLWRRLDLHLFFSKVLYEIGRQYPTAKTAAQKKQIALDLNFAEADRGQQIMRSLLPDCIHLSWPRAGKWPNAVYLCPWPYRPTAIVRGSLQPFAEELFHREQISLDNGARK